MTDAKSAIEGRRALEQLIARWRAHAKQYREDDDLASTTLDICADELDRALATSQSTEPTLCAKCNQREDSPFAYHIRTGKEDFGHASGLVHTFLAPSPASPSQKLGRAGDDSIRQLAEHLKNERHADEYGTLTAQAILSRWILDHPASPSAPQKADSVEWWREVAQGLGIRCFDMNRALDAAWQDIHDWIRFARDLRSKVENPNFSSLTPTEAGIAKSEAVLRQIGEASKPLASPLSTTQEVDRDER